MGAERFAFHIIEDDYDHKFQPRHPAIDRAEDRYPFGVTAMTT